MVFASDSDNNHDQRIRFDQAPGPVLKATLTLPNGQTIQGQPSARRRHRIPRMLGARPMKCVKCEGKLVTVWVEEVCVDQCDRCGGIWFDALELERVVVLSRLAPLLGRGAVRPGDDERRGRCPRCRGEGYLVRVAARTAPIHVDTCAACGGKWLDGGELDLLRNEGFLGKLRRLVDWVLDLDLR
jgi:uncharacterized protein